VDTATDAAASAVAVSPAAVAQLEAIRDQWLAPLVERNEALARDLGRAEADRDAARDRLVAAEAEAERLRAEVVRLGAARAGAVDAAAAAERDRAAARYRADVGDAERDRLRAELLAVEDARDGPGAARGAEAGPFVPAVAAWRARTPRAVDADEAGAPPPWWRFWGRRR
jgi:hypothetical protein